MRTLSILPIVFIYFSSVFIGCNSVERNSTSLCKEFYSLNNKKMFNELYNVVIGKGRVSSVYNATFKQYDLIFKYIDVFDSANSEFVTLPILDHWESISEFDSIFRTFSPQEKDFLLNKFGNISQKELFISYSKYVRNILKTYYQIETPKWFSSRNVVIDGNPLLGKFITFTLSNNCKCYFLENPNTLNPYWSNYFKKLNKLDAHWYFETNEK